MSSKNLQLKCKHKYEYLKAELENPTLAEVLNEWNDRRLELKKISNATHLRNKQIFNRHYKGFEERRIKSIDSDIMEELLEAQIPLRTEGQRHGFLVNMYLQTKTESERLLIV